MTGITRSALSLLGCLLAVLGVLAEPPVVDYPIITDDRGSYSGVITQVEPKQGFVDADTPIAIHGAGFEPQAKVALLPGGLVGGVSTPGDARSVAVSGRYAYVADGGLQVIDISNPASPVLVGTAAMQHGGAHAVAVAGTHAYVTGVVGDAVALHARLLRSISSGWLGIVDVSDPASPREVGSLEFAGYCYAGESPYCWCESYFAGGVAVSEGYAFLTLYDSFRIDALPRDRRRERSGGATVGRVGVPTLRVRGYGLASLLPTSPSPGPMRSWPRMESELYIVDVSDPASPSLEATYATPGYAMGVTVSGTHAFVAGGDSGLSIIDVSNPAAPSLVGIVDTLGWAQHVAVSGDTAFVADGDEHGPTGTGVAVIDVSDPAVPALLCRHSTPGEGAGVAVAGGYAFVADGPAGLQITDGQCAGSGLVGSYDALGGPQDIELSGNHAFVADGGAGLQILDVSNPAAPSRLGGVGLPNSARSVAVSGNHAYVAVADMWDYESSSSLQIVDVADPAAPSVVGATGCSQPLRE